jgi:hypothetical protein
LNRIKYNLKEMPRVIGSVYTGRGEDGDFLWMNLQEEHEDSLFIFNDNIEHHATARRGRGNAIMRRFNIHNPEGMKPKSAGIPTGSMESGGFTELNELTRKHIDDSLEEIKHLIKTFDYKKIYYSAESPNGILGTNLFWVNEDVLVYITNKIKELEDSS